MSAFMDFKVEGTGLANAALQRLLDAGKKVEPIIKGINAIMIRSAKTNFREQADPITGRPWQALSDATLARRRTGKRAGSAKILMDTGGLMGSILADESVISQGRAKVGSNKRYARIHQEGGRIRKRVSKNPKYKSRQRGGPHIFMPQRRYLGIGKDLELEIESYILMRHKRAFEKPEGGEAVAS